MPWLILACSAANASFIKDSRQTGGFAPRPAFQLNPFRTTYWYIVQGIQCSGTALYTGTPGADDRTATAGGLLSQVKYIDTYTCNESPTLHGLNDVTFLLHHFGSSERAVNIKSTTLYIHSHVEQHIF